MTQQEALYGSTTPPSSDIDRRSGERPSWRSAGLRTVTDRIGHRRGVQRINVRRRGAGLAGRGATQLELHNLGTYTQAELAELFGVGRSTTYRTLDRMRPAPPEPVRTFAHLRNRQPTSQA
jgi:hypothetical protein